MAIADIEKMIAVGLIWGATNALMRKGAIIWDQKSLKSSQSNQTPLHNRIILSLQNYLNLILTWQYSVPLFLNLSASASFFAILGHTPISLAVPVTNATTFAATALMGMLLGEKTRIGYALFGTLFIVFGVWLCVM
ncbi:transmembrane protein 234 homolog [Chenopodium quinoa]|uniref:transmembrane protein 234 homolog n=1 Tax=Chenopodium quinoa TaxID=63459 RepID=UPI000B774525|nr:transmembrane protein 234 homolog [Chenopodium quinoa]